MPIPTFCGIDFGTSNSAISIASTQTKPTLINVENSKSTIPSSIFYPADKNQPLFGTDANQAYISGEQGRFMRSLKRVLGTDLMSSGTLINNKLLSFEAILSHFLCFLKTKAENTAQAKIESVVMGRPVQFRDNDPKADKQAEKELYNIAKSVGFKNIVFQFEPIAAAYAHEEEVTNEKLALVIDIGGGTSDFSIIKIGKSLQSKTDRSQDILASTGIRIGGNDFDKDLAIESFMPELGMHSTYGNKNLTVPNITYFELAEWSKVNSVYTYTNIKMLNKILTETHNPDKYSRLLNLVETEQGHTLLSYVENTKIKLTNHNTLNTNLNFLPDSPSITTTKTAFEDSIKSDVNKTLKSIQECLNQAQITNDKIELTILTGGSTEIPYIQTLIKQTFPLSQISQENKLSSVGLGLAFDALRRF